uniref:Uncharacterized protein n=1 Tax=Denticeps clupeoides TaxID=299321 RepID=A0AAY4BEL3_9TELE
MGTNAISSLKDTSGTHRFENKYINQIMKQYYQNLYSSECHSTEQRMDFFFIKLDCPLSQLKSKQTSVGQLQKKKFFIL